MRTVVIAVLASLALGLGCNKTASVDLKLVEACDQKNQALNGISSFRVSSSGSTDPNEDNIVTFTKDQGSAPLNVGLGNVVVTVQAFTDPGAALQASAVPQALGRTMPLPITAQTGDVSSMVLMGKLDSFGKTTSKDGVCTSMTEGAPILGRHGHTATFVPGLNKVLIVGGAVFDDQGNEHFLSTAELYDPADGTFTKLPDLLPARAYHAATALPDGRVLISGGLGIISGQVSSLRNLVMFDPAAGDNPFVELQSLSSPRAHHTSTLMAGAGIVAIVGGCSGTAVDGCSSTAASAGNQGPTTEMQFPIETFDVSQPTAFSSGPASVPKESSLQTGRAFHQAVSLENGPNTILAVTGGANVDGPVCTAELFRLENGSLTRIEASGIAPFPTGKCPSRAAAVALDAHRALIIGGQTAAPNGQPQGTGTADVFFFQDATGIDQGHAFPLFNGGGRADPQAALLSDGSVLVVGGAIAQDAPTAEVLRVGAGPDPFTPQTLAGSSPGEAREEASLTVLPTDQVLYCGGFNAQKQDSPACEVYFGP